MAVTRAGTALPCALAMALGAGACEDRPTRNQDLDDSSMKADKLTAHELLDLVPRYFARIRREDIDVPGAFDRLVATSPEYKAWRAKRDEAWDKRREWDALIVSLRPELPEYKLWNQLSPAMSSYEGQVTRLDAPELADGLIKTSLVIRVSYIAPVYEMYETSTRVLWTPHMKDPKWMDRRRTHEISPAFQPAADVFARAIEAHYGYQRVGPEVLDIQLVNVAMWEDGWYTGTLAEALFSVYRL